MTLRRIVQWVGGVILSLGVILGLYFNLHRWVIPNLELRSSDSYFIKRHQYDLVNWHLFNNRTLAKAKKLNKPIMISIGNSSSPFYSNVQKNSFQDPLIARLINRYFIPVVIDYDDNSEISRLFENVKLRVGYSNFPLISVLTPDGMPVFSQRLETPGELLSGVKFIISKWRKNPNGVVDEGNAWLKMYHGLFYPSGVLFNENPLENVSELFDHIYNNSQSSFSLGWDAMPPFFLFYNYLLSTSNEFDKYAQQTMNRILTSPYFDMVEGGVHLFSVSSSWDTPVTGHLLIDQINFCQLLALIYSKTKNEIYLDIALFNVKLLMSKFQNDDYLFINAVYTTHNQKDGRYFLMENSILDRLKPVNFNIVPYSNEWSMVSLFKVSDFYNVDRRDILNRREKIKFILEKDSSIIIKSNAKLLTVLTQLNQLKPNPLITSQIQKLSEALLSNVDTPMPLLDQLMLYDALSYKKPMPLITRIQGQLDSQFPFIKNNPLLPNMFQVPLSDSLHYEHPLYFLLKHRADLLPQYTTAQMCRDIASRLVNPWDQMSLIYVYNSSCLNTSIQ
jgi:uncharacterized protein YyaL (SSP411 family)